MQHTRRTWVVGMAASLALGGRSSGLAASSQVPEAALAAYRDGQWAQARLLGEAAGGAVGYGFAARAVLTEVLLAGAKPPMLGKVREGRALAERALRLEPRHVEGRLQLATALGMLARNTAPAMAVAQQWPQRSKALLLAVTRDAPQEVWGHALLGGWHLEALRVGGAAAGRFLGARLGHGRASFEKAMALDTEEPAVPFFFGAGLLVLEPAAHSEECAALVNAAAQTRGTGAFQAEIRRRSRLLGARLGSGDVAGATALASAWL